MKIIRTDNLQSEDYQDW